METIIPEHISERRRKTLMRYTLFALIAYHSAVVVIYLAYVVGVAPYSLTDLALIELAIVLSHLLFLAAIKAKRSITKAFINSIMYVQFLNCMFLMTWAYIIMEELGYLVLLNSQIAVIFMFIQFSLPISIFIVGLVIADFLCVSFIRNQYDIFAIQFRFELVMVWIYVSCSVFTAFICRVLLKQQKVIKESRNQLRSTYKELDETHNQLQINNKHTVKSLRYAEMIQRAILPGMEHLSLEDTESLVIWIPKEIVGGDVFDTFRSSGKTLVVLMDCTGHGVPGAFLTLIAYSEIRKIVLDQICYDPADILERLNRSLKNILHKNSDESLVTGMDGAIVEIDHTNCRVRFAGARMSLYAVRQGVVDEIKGDKQSLGYETSKEDFKHTTHELNLDRGNCLYMKTDGMTDQLGGVKRIRFGGKRFASTLAEIYGLPFKEQRQQLIERFMQYKGTNDQIDDVTVIGFRM